MIRLPLIAAAIAPLMAWSAGAQAQSTLAGQWSEKAPLPTTRSDAAAVTVNGKIYLIGGDYPSKKYDIADNAEYDVAADRWRMLSPMPSGLNHVGLTTLNGKIYAMAGFVSNGHKGVTDKAYEYDIASDTWRTLLPLRSPRGAVALAAVDGKVHLFGGRKNENDVVAEHDVYDPATGAWSDAAPLPKGRDHMAAVTVSGKIHVVGGRFGANEDSTGLHAIYDPKTDSWTAAPQVPTPRGGGAGTLFSNMIVFLGGEDDHRTYDENEAYDLATGQWRTLAPMPTGRHGFGLAAVGDGLYVIAGARGRGGREPTSETLLFRLK